MPESTIVKYNARWGSDVHPLIIEMRCIQKGGEWITDDGRICGLGLSHHFEQMRRIMWPNLNTHRWHDLCRDAMVNHRATVFMGPASTGKTHEAAWFYLCDYLCFPEETCVLVSSTHIDGLRLRVWGELTQLWQEALDNFGHLTYMVNGREVPVIAGNLLDSKILISTDKLSESQFEERRVRDWRKGIKGVPCVVGGKFVGLGKFSGIKQKRMRLLADELQFMGGSFLSSVANLSNNIDFRCTFVGNPVDVMDPLGVAAEPVAGWQIYIQPEKTTCWNTRFMDGYCVNLIGTDTPNNDYPDEKEPRFPYLITKRKIDSTKRTFGEDSLEYQSQCIGSMKSGLLQNRVLTRQICEQFGALNDVIWRGTSIKKIFGLDAAYGGDRCVGGHCEFGEDVDGNVIFSVNPPQLVPVNPASTKPPEDQIADWVRNYCEAEGIPAEDAFHDSTGRGSLGTSLSRLWSPMTNPVEFGGSPTDRPVSLDIYIFDQATKQKRLKKCSEHYVNFVTELWYSIRYAVEASQVRNLPKDVMEELCMRKWEMIREKKRQVEPKRGTPAKPGMKERTGRSPDLGDWLAICLEGARRRGFQISKLANEESDGANDEVYRDIARRSRSLRSAHSLNYSV